MKMRDENGILSWPTRISYAGGDVACNVIFGMVGTLLTIFYTDYVGINPATVGLVMLLSRLFNGVSDLGMGIIVEKTKSKWGKSRPWILWMSVPYALSAILLFTVPHSTSLVQGIYIFVAYNFCTTICYTAVNLPYGSLSAMMTRISAERDMLSLVRMGLSPLGRIMAVTFTLPLVKMFGNNQAAWVKTMSVWAVVALILLLICFARCKETVKIAAREKAEKVPVKKALKTLIMNQYFWAVLVLWMFQSVSFGISGTILPYYCKYIFNNDTWMYSTLYLTETLILVGCIFLCAPFIRKFEKRNVALIGGALALVGQWKSHIRQESMIFAGGSIGTKVGAGVTSALMTGLLSLAGYVSSVTGNAIQPESALEMIVNIYKIGPLIVAGGVIIVLSLYKLDKKYPLVMSELVERESRGEM